MKSLLLISAFSLGTICISVQAEEINPRTLDDKNTLQQQQERASQDGKSKSLNNATDQQSDPKVKNKHNKEKSKTDQENQSTRTHP
ncbi:hypothetical protein LG200_01925 [Methylobacillus caricis]|uniref:hypothetical protein n=1 Tax=Methylobacillus caricis TaxID=1971611 RepID=UPI001CFFD443|nr:hypothetical protein [Methylobacillus caricis]MCB5186759.1 hypothetical protein [Methylobacillus caricis]